MAPDEPDQNGTSGGETSGRRAGRHVPRRMGSSIVRPRSGPRQRNQSPRTRARGDGEVRSPSPARGSVDWRSASWRSLSSSCVRSHIRYFGGIRRQERSWPVVSWMQTQANRSGVYP
jgi:hypothetical protein